MSTAAWIGSLLGLCWAGLIFGTAIRMRRQGDFTSKESHHSAERHESGGLDHHPVAAAPGPEG